MFSRDPVFVSLSPTSIRVGVIARGEVVRVERVRLTEGEYAKAWQQDLRSLDEPLRAAINALNIAPGTPARILYSSPGAFAEVFLTPAGGAAAVQAAELYVRQTLGGAPGKWVTTQRVLDHVGGNGGGLSRVAILTIADERAHLDALAGWARRGGLVPQRAMPSRGAALASIVHGAPAGDAEASMRARMDEHSLTLAGWQHGQLVFARSADVGYALLIEAVHRAAHTTPEPLSHEAAARWLFAFGLPQRDSMVSDAQSMMADALMPLVQPSLQRFVVEIRQTMRFGFTNADLSRINVELCGPGGSIPGLAQSMSAMLDGVVGRRGADDAPLSSGVAEDQLGDLPLGLKLPDRACWMEPPAERERKEERVLGQAARAGAAVAACALGLMAWNAARATRQLDRQRAALAPEVARIESAAQSGEQHAQRMSELGLMTSVIDSGMKDSVSWRGVVNDVCGLVHEGIEINAMDARRASDGNFTLTLRGRVVGSSRRGGPDPIGAFVTSLQESMLVHSVRIVSAQLESQTGAAEFHIEIVPARVSTVSKVLVEAESGKEAP